MKSILQLCHPKVWTTHNFFQFFLSVFSLHFTINLPYLLLWIKLHFVFTKWRCLWTKSFYTLHIYAVNTYIWYVWKMEMFISSSEKITKKKWNRIYHIISCNILKWSKTHITKFIDHLKCYLLSMTVNHVYNDKLGVELKFQTKNTQQFSRIVYNRVMFICLHNL